MCVSLLYSHDSGEGSAFIFACARDFGGGRCNVNKPTHLIKKKTTGGIRRRMRIFARGAARYTSSVCTCSCSLQCCRSRSMFVYTLSCFNMGARFVCYEGFKKKGRKLFLQQQVTLGVGVKEEELAVGGKGPEAGGAQALSLVAHLANLGHGVEAEHAA